MGGDSFLERGAGRHRTGHSTQRCHRRLQLREGLSFQMVHYWRITILKINSPPYERDQIEGNMLLCFLVLFHGKQGSKNALQN